MVQQWEKEARDHEHELFDLFLVWHFDLTIRIVVPGALNRWGRQACAGHMPLTDPLLGLSSAGSWSGRWWQMHIDQHTAVVSLSRTSCLIASSEWIHASLHTSLQHTLDWSTLNVLCKRKPYVSNTVIHFSLSLFPHPHLGRRIISLRLHWQLTEEGEFSVSRTCKVRTIGWWKRVFFSKRSKNRICSVDRQNRNKNARRNDKRQWAGNRFLHMARIAEDNAWLCCSLVVAILRTDHRVTLTDGFRREVSFVFLALLRT